MEKLGEHEFEIVSVSSKTALETIIVNVAKGDMHAFSRYLWTGNFVGGSRCRAFYETVLSVIFTPKKKWK